MGKSVPKNIKRRSEYLLNSFPEKFSTDFEKNKDSLAELELPLSMQSRNWVAGFITRTLADKKKAEAK
jgi:small subunit ribosomal protein S17e